MPIRIVTGGISQETNTFQWQPTTLEDFQRGSSAIHRGEDILALEGTGTVYGGVIAEAKRQGIELIPTTFARAVPGGRVTRHAFETLCEEILDGLRRAQPFDGVLLVIHGAMALEHHDDGEGLLLRAVRDLVGPDIPIVSPLDLHTNLSDEMMALADAFVGYKEYPHIDTAETGARALQILVETIRGNIRPAMAHVRLPLIVPNQSMVTTWQSPLKTAIDRAREIEREPGVVAATVLGGFPFADVPFAGVSTIVVTDNDPVLARRYATELARICWDLRETFRIEPTPIPDAIAEAMAAPPGSVYVLADIADSGASGTAGDGTAVLKGLLEANARSAAVAQIMDPEAVHACIDAGVGATVTLRVGGKHDGLHGEPVEVTGMVRLIHEGSFVLAGPMGKGTVASRGKTVVLEIGGRDGIELQLTELRGHPNDLNFFRAFGIEPTERRILVLKSAAHFRAAFEPIATKVIEVDAPGISSPRLERFDYRKLRRPIYPLDPETTWSPEA
ncbi:M81 family metallopeptidase [Thermomicrobiaceae bacterium CFH 74404]|uniref:M81 family metallopeptidase n=1 Tax=Thermalbibacter longus TaxID=2951981 RepID=A0AA41WHR2_9BACT|nr:M81 family metallopeptidase [Thermalbibacter longus]MCM8750343.1 M81 family metallopeptidase [Thermalbibacter longus]